MDNSTTPYDQVVDQARQMNGNLLADTGRMRTSNSTIQNMLLGLFRGLSGIGPSGRVSPHIMARNLQGNRQAVPTITGGDPHGSFGSSDIGFGARTPNSFNNPNISVRAANDPIFGVIAGGR